MSKNESLFSLKIIFQELKEALEDNKFQIGRYSVDPVCMLMEAYNESYEKQAERIIVTYKEDRITITIANAINNTLNAKKLNAIIKDGDMDFFNVNSRGVIERIILADEEAYPDVDDIINKFTRAYATVVTT